LEFGLVKQLTPPGRTTWITGAHRGDGKRFVVRADEKLTAFVELEAARFTQTIMIKTRRSKNAERDEEHVK
jgi:hypothetical protein